MKHSAAVLEELLPLSKEISVVLTRGADGAVALFPTAENRHCRGILDVSIAPADLTAMQADEAQAIARRLAAALQYVGVLAVEMFVVRGEILLNEIAPRPHNSGHYTLEGAVTSQFEQQVRAVCGLPLGDPSLVRPAAMVNLLGDVWPGVAQPNAAANPLLPDWACLLAEPGVHLHLYGKTEPRRGRKMGHFTVTAATRDGALQRALRLRQKLGIA
jgi:5-(carboxyamino)imidazole ribonucleotide synthase